MKKLFYFCVSAFILSQTILMPVIAQDTTAQKSSDKRWSFLVEPYLMFPNMNGTLALSTLPEATLEATVGDIFNKLQIGFMLNVEAGNDKWTIGSDFIYMDLAQDVNQGTVITGGEAGAKQLAWELSGMRKVLPWLEVGVSGILNTVSSDLDINVDNIGPGTTNRSAEVSKSWVEPMIVARVKSKADKTYIYQIRGEIGGFGIGSDFAWQAEADLGFHFSKLLQVTAGYRIISLDYSTGSGTDLFVYNVDTFGPVIRFGFNF